MDKTSIKNFAIWARNKLIADIGYKASLMGITEEGISEALSQSTISTEFYDIGTDNPYAISTNQIKQRKRLVEVIRKKEADTDYKTAYKYIIEEVAYTWFNRLIAIRFMEVNDYLPSRMRVLSSVSGKHEPDIVTNPFVAELELSDDDKEKITAYKSDNNIDELFNILFIKQCNALNTILPALFEKTDDYTELLLNLSVIDRDGVVYKLVTDIAEDDFNIEKGGQVEIIGWLYQYYNSEPKAAAFAKKGKISKEEIPAVTQLFTPDWIVRYMVENSLGRLWVEGHTDEELKANWKYYLEEAAQEAEVKKQLTKIRKEYSKLSPEDIKIIDPCVGSGHILVYAFDVLIQIYESAGYSTRDAAKYILEHNIYGLDIDDRAFQLAYFAIMMKARQYNRRILNGEYKPNIYSIKENNNINREQLNYLGSGCSEDERNKALEQIGILLDTFKDAKEYGSILNVEKFDAELLEKFISQSEPDGQISMHTVGIEETIQELRQIIAVGKVLSEKYHTVVTNPPYAGTSNLSPKLNSYIKENYPDSKSDLFAVFIERCSEMTGENGYQAMITQHSWMFLSSFEKLRKKMMQSEIINMAHLGARAFEEIGGEVVQVTAFVRCIEHIKGYRGTYCRLIEPTSQQGKEKMFLDGENRYITVQDNFKKIPGEPVAYWLCKNALDAFNNVTIGDVALLCQGLTTTNNDLYIRQWYEVQIDNIGFGISDIVLAKNSNKTWFPFNKGGLYRKWYGNNELVVNYWNDGEQIKKDVLRKYPYLKTPDFVVKNSKTYFKGGLTWSAISNTFSIRQFYDGSICADKGQGLFTEWDMQFYLASLLNSKVGSNFLNVISPTLDFNCGYVRKVPFISSTIYFDKIINIATSCVDFSRSDWDSYETSWDFVTHPLIKPVLVENNSNRSQTLIADCYNAWVDECESRFNNLKANEEELNRIFIDIYGLQDELAADVADKDITVHRIFDTKEDILESMKGSNYVRTKRDEVVSLLSYAVGCMFGRYSLDVEGLAYAGGEWDDSKYITFKPDDNNIIPITDEEYLDDDIVTRLCTWLKVVYGESTIEANLDFIADALGGKGNTSREIIRNYFLNDFFKDHCSTYSVTGSGKRPIYWLFDAGKQNGFKALIYLHRYNADTIGNLRIDYLHLLQRIYESESKRMQSTLDSANSPREVALASKRKEKLQKQLKECHEYDEKIAHLALSRIELDLDDGVKVNYRKIQTDRDGKFYDVLADSKNIMSKEK
ncbi:BREX-1 system adenine-specific DNA-methyltransferase PglX [Lachnoanaerobaculum orale]|uniref:BREX-1 system adenine-specific DNA-methyltransferase PglX n=1 Tax=Lachnoanaerobaculum orale TaxID=979627 RepID=UPI0023A7A049|nr:BREX-1 system adenine-specific DNA-methyltransferase PglX [Lachnoanaerobaculum orale]